MIDQLRKRLLDREHPVRIHLIGVAGSGMSGLARMLLEMGHRVSGCDRVTSTETERLQQAGLIFSSPHSATAVSDAEVVIYSSAIREENVALHAARENGCLCLRRAECLAAILNNKKGVVVAGTHGKTTTSSLTAHLLREGRMRPCHYVGAEIPVLGANAHWNSDSEYLIAEGDESDGTLVNYLPEHSIVLNIEAEHLDFYRDLDHIKRSSTVSAAKPAATSSTARAMPVRRTSARSTPTASPTAGKMPTTPPLMSPSSAGAPSTPSITTAPPWGVWNSAYRDATTSSTRWQPRRQLSR